MFWLDESDVSNYEDNSVTSLNIYVDDELKTTFPVANALATKPACGTDNDFSKAYTFYLGSSPSRSFTFAVKDDTGETWKSGTWTASGGGCLSIDI